MRLGRNLLRRCPALVLLGLALACSRPGSESCADGQECGGLGEAEPPPALISMPAGVPLASGCGDGIFDPEHEECDDGSACRDGRDCTEEPARCQVGGGDRSCAPRAADGCSAECKVEPGFRCAEPGPCQPLAAPPAASAAPPGSELSPAPAPSSSTSSGAVDGAGSGGTGAVPLPGAACDVARFEEPERVLGLNLDPGVLGLALGGVQLWAPALASDATTLYFAAAQPGVPERIYFASRSPRARRFTDATALSSLDSGAGDGTPLLSHDGLRLYFYSRRAGGTGERDLWLATRAEPSVDFEPPTPLAGVNSPALDHLPWLSADELTLLFVSNRPGGAGQSDLWLARRSALEKDFTPPELLSTASSAADEGRGLLSSSGDTLIFASDRALGEGQHDLWLATRADGAADFGEARPLSELNGPGMELDPFLTLDERELFFVSDRSGRPEIWSAQRSCDD